MMQNRLDYMNTKSCFFLVTCFILGIFLTGCAKVEPWQRQYLASPEMSYDSMPLNYAFREHIYFSREAANGEKSAAGGGCGCN